MTSDNATKLDLPEDSRDYGFSTTGYTGGPPPLTIEQLTALAFDPTPSIQP